MIKNAAQKWEDWKQSTIGKEAMLSVDREAAMFQAFKAGIFEERKYPDPKQEKLKILRGK